VGVHWRRRPHWQEPVTGPSSLPQRRCLLALESAFAVPWSDLLPQSPVLSAGSRRSRDEAAELLEGIVVVLAGEADAMNDYDASIRLAHLLADVLDAIDWMAA
jgi:hypothetical protein